MIFVESMLEHYTILIIIQIIIIIKNHNGNNYILYYTIQYYKIYKKLKKHYVDKRALKTFCIHTR